MNKKDILMVVVIAAVVGIVASLITFNVSGDASLSPQIIRAHACDGDVNCEAKNLIAENNVCAGESCLGTELKTYSVEVPAGFYDIMGVHMPHEICFLTGQKITASYYANEFIRLDSSCRIRLNLDGTNDLEAENSIGNTPKLKCFATCLGPLMAPNKK